MKKLSIILQKIFIGIVIALILINIVNNPLRFIGKSAGWLSDPYQAIGVIVATFLFIKSQHRIWKLLAFSLCCAIVGYVFAASSCNPEWLHCVMLRENGNIFIIKYIIYFLFWAYLFYFVRFMVRLARKKETLPKISISDLKEKLRTYWEKLKYGIAKVKSLVIKAGTTNILLAVISVLLLMIVAKLYRW